MAGLKDYYTDEQLRQMHTELQALAEYDGRLLRWPTGLTWEKLQALQLNGFVRLVPHIHFTDIYVLDKEV